MVVKVIPIPIIFYKGTVAVLKIKSVKNARAWISMVSYLKK